MKRPWPAWPVEVAAVERTDEAAAVKRVEGMLTKKAA